MSVVLDIDGEHFKRHVRAIDKELSALMNLYLPPRTGGRIQDLWADLNELIAERDREIRAEIRA